MKNVKEANLLVKQFNERYKTGDKLLWKPIAAFGYTPIEVTVKGKAFINNGRALCFFNERSGFCSIDPEHLIQKLNKI